MLLASLRDLEYRVVGAAGGEAALDVARRARPGVVVLDLRLPDRDGYSVARQLRADPETAGCWIIALTAGGQPSEALAAGVDQFLWKPVRLDELEVAIAAGLARVTDEG
jgi:CheY-like chemotaxis protein